MCAPGWVLERTSNEIGVSIEARGSVRSLATDSVVVTAVSTLEQEGGIGFVAAVNVITGRCVELTACHPDVPPTRWPDLTLALLHGLGSAASVEIELIGASDVG